MHVSIHHHRSETRGSVLLPAMVFAWAIVLVVIMGLVFDPQWWFVGFALVVELGVVFAGARWLMPMLADYELVDPADTQGSHSTFAELAQRIVGVEDHPGDSHATRRTPAITPTIAASLGMSGPELSQTQLEEPALSSVATE